jgi:glucose-6-phosphate-specific signal transduction histidine kinase
VRSILERLRQGQPMVLPELDVPGVLEEWQRREPAVRFQVQGVHARALSLLGDAARATCARVLQEALANAFRHARPSRLSVRLAFEPRQARLIVGNDGVSGRPGPASAGHGIIGMRERACAGGGDLQAGPTAVAGHWKVTLSLPLAGNEEPRAAAAKAAAWAQPEELADTRPRHAAKQAQPSQEPLQDA